MSNPPTFYIDDQGNPYSPHEPTGGVNGSGVSFADSPASSNPQRMLELIGGGPDSPAQFRAIKVLKAEGAESGRTHRP